MSSEHPANPKPVRILLYSDDRTVREQVRLTLGRKVAPDLGEIVLEEFATHAAVMKAMNAGGIDLCILDGEAVPIGGMGITRQLKDEIAHCPPILILVGRIQDAWLATWSRADGVLAHPVDPIRLPQVVAELLRTRATVGA